MVSFVNYFSISLVSLAVLAQPVAHMNYTFAKRDLPSLPSVIPTDLPTGLPSGLPTGLPSGLPTDITSGLPIGLPSGLPTDLPTGLPTGLPTDIIPTGLIPTGLIPTGLIPTGLIPTGVPDLSPSGIEAAFASALASLGKYTNITGDITTLENDAVCIFNSFNGLQPAPNTSGIEWWEDAEFLLNLILHNAVIEYYENKTITTVETLITTISKDNLDILNQIASKLGLDGSLIEATGLSIENLVIGFINTLITTIVNAADQLEAAPGALPIDTLVNTALSTVESTLLGLVPAPLLPFVNGFCTVGSLLFSGVTAFEACTFNVDIVSQILSEIKNLLTTCS